MDHKYKYTSSLEHQPTAPKLWYLGFLKVYYTVPVVSGGNVHVNLVIKGNLYYYCSTSRTKSTTVSTPERIYISFELPIQDVFFILSKSSLQIHSL
jgi:hypothetical protein